MVTQGAGAMTQPGGNWLRPIDWDVLRAKCFTPVQGRILFVLWSRADGSGFCRPSIKSIAADCGCDERSVRDAIRVMTAFGVFEWEEHDGRPHGYRVNPDHVLNFVRTHPT